DLSEKAVEMAKKNAKRNQVDVEFLVGDLLNPFLHRKCDILVSNPPYVSQKEWETLDPEVKKEPTMALLGGESGLEYYKRFAIDAKKFFYPSAFLFFEMGRGQGKAIQSLFIEEGWGKGKIFMDLEGKDRFFFLEIE
ncbi:MAG: methyltransferase, partial [Chlamydiota bacterium]